MSELIDGQLDLFNNSAEAQAPKDQDPVMPEPDHESTAPRGSMAEAIDRGDTYFVKAGKYSDDLQELELTGTRQANKGILYIIKNKTTGSSMLITRTTAEKIKIK